MAGTSVGGLKAAEVTKKYHGDDFYKRIGSIGGKNGRGHAFAHGKFSPSEAGKIGGRISKRTKRYEAQND